jgi:hypothetical protein
MARSKTANAAINIAQVGKMPNLSLLDPASDDYKIRYSDALNYATMAFDDKELKEHYLVWAKSKNIQVTLFRNIPDYSFQVVGKIAWMVNNSAIIAQSSIDRLTTFAHNVVVEKDVVVAEAGISAEERNRRIRKIVISALEDSLDARTYMQTPNLVIELLNKYKPSLQVAEEIAFRFQEMLDEILLYGKDEQVTEGYSKMSKKDRELYTTILQEIQRGIITYKGNLRSTRASTRVVKVAKTRAKTREVKAAMKAAKSASTVKYMKESSELRVLSVDPTTIVGASQVILFNVKKRKATLLIAETQDGLTVKGTTIGGFSPTKSILKSIRKGTEQKVIPELRQNKKRGVVMFEKNIPGKSYNGDSISGRVNEETLILAAWK